MGVVGRFIPDFGSFGFLEWYFFLQLVGLVGVVGVFALYLVRNQFRNPGRRSRGIR
jgi:hypothetical protein